MFYTGNGAPSRGYYAGILPLEAALEVTSAEVAPAKVFLETLFEAFFVSHFEAVTAEDRRTPLGDVE